VSKPIREDGKFPTFAFPGGYTIIYLAADNEVLCPDCANLPEAYSTDEKREAVKKGLDREDGPPDYTDRQWELVDVSTYDEGLPMTCANCNKEIHSSYGPTDDDYEQMIKEHFESITGHAPSVSVLNKCLAYVQDKDSEQEGNYNRIGEWVHEFIDDDAHGHEKPVGRKQPRSPGRMDEAGIRKEIKNIRNGGKSGNRFALSNPELRESALVMKAAFSHHQFDVFLHGNKIETVWWEDGANAIDVRKSLINDEGYDPLITVKNTHTSDTAGRQQPSETTNTIEVWTYDVWGNEEDGYEVNDRSKIAEYETDLTELSDKDIKEIIEENFFHPETIDSDGNGDDQHVYLVLNDMDHSDYPLGEIYLDRG